VPRGSGRCGARNRISRVGRQRTINTLMTSSACVTATLMAAPAALGQDTAGISPDVLKGRPYSPYVDRAFATAVWFSGARRYPACLVHAVTTTTSS
jgi:hypothetical protein